MRSFLYLIFYACITLLATPKSSLYAQAFLFGNISSNFITSFAEDSQGYIWIGTNHGLNRYNGSNYAIFYAQKDSTALNSDYTSNLLFDSDQRLWMSNECGLCVWENNRFRHLQQVGFNPIGRILDLDRNSLIITDRKGIAKVNKHTLKEEVYFSKEGMGIIRPIIISSEQQIWTANTQIHANKINILNKDLKLLQTISCPPDVSIQHLMEDKQKRMWVTTDQGLLCYDVRSKKRLEIPSSLNQLSRQKRIHFLQPYQQGGLLIGIANEGIYYYNNQQDSLLHIHTHQKLKDKTYVCYIDSHNGIWLSNQKDDFQYYPAQLTYSNLSSVQESMKDPFIKDLAFDQEGFLWIRSSKDIICYNIQSDQIVSHWKTDLFFGNLFIDSRNDIWIINNYLEVRQYSTQQGKLNLKRTYSFPNNVFSISEDKSGRIWATLSDRFAILTPNGDFTYQYAPNGISFSQLRTLKPTRSMILFTISNGIYKFGDDQQFIPLDSLFVANPNTITVDPKGTYWIGTYNTGLIKYIPQTHEIKRFDTTSGLIENNIKSVIEDKNGNIWFSTSTHITKYDVQNDIFSCVYDKRFTKGNLYGINCCAIAPNGAIYFGGSGGITVVYPDKQAEEAEEIPLNLDLVIVGNQVIRNLPDRLLLDYRDNMITFWYSGLDFKYGASLNYAYQLEGFDKKWINAGTNKRVTYSNLPSGNYTFKVKVRKLNGEWGKNELSMNIHIQPAPWKSPWAITSYWLLGIALTGLSIWIIVRWRVQQERLALAERQKEMNQEHIDFVTNISHEFRTPLSLIYAPLKELVHNNSLDESSRQLLNTMQRNAERLLQLSRQIVDSNKSEKEEKELHVTSGNIGTFICSLTENFQFIVHQRDITLEVRHEEVEDGYFDAEKIEKILYNLISNAIKYTPDGGHITVYIHTDKQHAYIEVKDTGIGIPPEKKENIFKRFNRLDTKMNVAGSGIGLHYAQQLAHLHKGSITYKPNVPQGSCFIVEFPIHREAYHKDEFADNTSFFTTTSILPNPSSTDQSSKEKKATLVIAEDNMEVRNYLQRLLSQDYHIMAASNGEEVLECLALNVPDLILSDIVMPHKDGYELCRIIKASTEWGHIPVVLLTAKSDTQSNIQGLDCGADAYVGKPFDPFYLKAVVENLLANRQKIQRIIQNLTSGHISQEKIHETMLNEHDHTFLEKLHAQLDQHLDDEEFSINLLAKKLGMSYSSLYARIKSLTGQTPQNFLITYRMNTAMQLLKSGNYTVSEVCYKVGASSLANFSRSFKRQFGIPPSEVQ